MKYLLLIYSDEQARAGWSGEHADAMFGAYRAFTHSIGDSGALVAGEALHPVSTSTTVRVNDDEVLVTDGPFAETKEQLGGYYVVECVDLDEAIEIAARIPDARGGSVEIRPVLEPPTNPDP